MKRRDIPRLAAAFVVTFSAGCGEAPPPTPEPLHWNPPGPEREPIVKQPDGTCAIEIHGNPPAVQPVPCPDATSTSTSTFAEPPQTAAPVATTAPTTTRDPDLEVAPSGWRVEPNTDGTCTAYGPDPCNHPGCNPPRPRKVACPPDMKPKK